MADSLSVFNVPSAADVAQAQAAEYSKGLTSARGATVRRTASQIGLDAVFGNPMVNRAKQIENLVKQGDLDAEEQFDKEGIEDPAQKQMIRMEAIRNRVKDVNPGLALQLEDQIRQLRVADLERQKLTQTVRAGDQQLKDMTKRYGFNPDTFEQEVWDISTPEGDAQYKQALQDGWATSDKAGGILNIYSAERAGKRQWQLKMMEMAEKSAEEQAKKAEADVPDYSLEKTTRTHKQEALGNRRYLLDNYRRVADTINADPELVNIWSRAGSLGTQALRKAGIKLSDDQRARVNQFTAMQATAMDAANTLIKERSGAAVTAQEWERLRVVLPLTTDDPDTFISKLQEFYTILSRAQRRDLEALNQDDYRVFDESGDKFASKEDALFGGYTDMGEPAPPAAPAPPIGPATTGGGITFVGFE